MENQFGKVSKLELVATKKEEKTILEEVSFTAPFKIMRPFYEKPEWMTVMLLTASAGIMAGDYQEFKITLKENAQMEFVSQAYEKIHKMKEGMAKRKTFISIEKNAKLHYVPLPTIPFANSAYQNQVEVELIDKTSKFTMLEILSAGRVGHGEAFLYRLYQNQVNIRKAGKLIYRDNTRFEPEFMDMEGFGMYESFTYLGNLVMCNEEKDENWIKEVRELLDETNDVEGGVTIFDEGSSSLVRILAKSAEKLIKLMEQIMDK